MGIGQEIYEFESSLVKANNLCDLGSQTIRAEVAGKETAAKDFPPRFTNEYLAIDIGGYDNSLPLDLCKSVKRQKPDLENRFDVVTNYGTIEHVENQPRAFMNIDSLAMPGGLILHAFMISGYWPNHGLWKYTEDFGHNLASLVNYEVEKSEFVFRSGRGDRKMGLFALRKPYKNCKKITWKDLRECGLKDG